MPRRTYVAEVIVESHDPVRIVRESLVAALSGLDATVGAITLTEKRVR